MPFLLANGEQPHRGHLNHHNATAPCASQNAASGGITTLPKSATGAQNHSGEVTRSSKVQMAKRRAFRYGDIRRKYTFGLRQPIGAAL